MLKCVSPFHPYCSCPVWVLATLVSLVGTLRLREVRLLGQEHAAELGSSLGSLGSLHSTTPLSQILTIKGYQQNRTEGQEEG